MSEESYGVCLETESGSFLSRTAAPVALGTKVRKHRSRASRGEEAERCVDSKFRLREEIESRYPIYPILARSLFT